VQSSPCLPTSAAALAVAASLAAWSRHPLSDALAAAAEQPAARQWLQVEELPGQGLSGTDAGGRSWRLGSRAWAGGVASAAMPPSLQADVSQVWLRAGDGGCASFDFDEALRDGAVEAMSRLRAMGYQLNLLSGDDPARAQRLAQQLQLHAAIGGVTPQGKLAEVARAQARGERVAMIGDGVNDAPVLARADVSLAMGQGALVARAQADAVLVANRPMDIVRTLEVSRRAMRIVRQNMVWALVYNAACIPLALAGLLPPWAAGLGMASSSVLVVLNALRVAR
jgi:P-type Cu2+ transporter